MKFLEIFVNKNVFFGCCIDTLSYQALVTVNYKNLLACYLKYYICSYATLQIYYKTSNTWYL